MENITYSKKLDVKYSAPVVVVGGGPAGVAAAVAAARNGGKTLLIEKSGCLGGLGTNALVPLFMGFKDNLNFYAGGIGKEVLDLMGKYAGGIIDHFGNEAINPEALKFAYDELVTNEKNIELIFFSEVVDVIHKDGVIETLILGTRSGLCAVKGNIFIDCTGSGEIVSKTDAECVIGDEDKNIMGATLCSLWGGVDWTKVEYGEDKYIEQAYKDGVFEQLDLHLPGMVQHGDNTSGGNLGHIYNAYENDEKVLTASILKGRKQAREFLKFYKTYVPGYKNCELMATGSVLGTRELRRYKGDYTLNVDDFINRAVFDDEIGRMHYPVDLHASNNSKEDFDKYHEEFNEKFVYKDGDSYGVPLSCLIPKGVKNLYTAGRLLSADRSMLATLRVMPGCYITGQAVGVAAAICKNETRNIDIYELQKRLKKMGAYLPNFKEK